MAGTTHTSTIPSVPDHALWEATERATKRYGLCPNRLWACASVHPWREKIVPYLMQLRPGEPMRGHGDHRNCNYDVCVYAHLESTEMPQRHELQLCSNSCKRSRYRFSMALLKNSIKARKLAAWKLDGSAPIKPHQPFMAVSHVWSDGTGVGDWPGGEVNPCLYNYFRGIAERFQCEGIWWDTICIPTDEDVRRLAISRMQTNYEEARVTLVHDCYLRSWKWFDAESACIAIIMSPWFSRGWTALELSHSRRVKVIFKDNVIKDLDEEILANPRTMRHRIAVDLISALRRITVTSVNDLLQVFQSRYCSHQGDMAVVSGLLAGIRVEPRAHPIDIYQAILAKIGAISHDQLFHKSAAATRGPGWCWCPVSLMEMQVSPIKPALRVLPNGCVTGPWRVIRSVRGVPFPDGYNWIGIHQAIQLKLRVAMREPDKHLFLVEPTVTKTAVPIKRALLVKTFNDKILQFVSAVYFNAPLKIRGKDERPMNVTIC